MSSPQDAFSQNVSNQPILVIGLYITAASALLLLMAVHHLIVGIRKQMWWFPCGSLLSLNAGTLSVLAIAVKLPNDISTPMDGSIDQLAKLSGSVLVVTTMAASMPSLGSMKNVELISNVAALALLVITLVVNVCIQIGIGIISSRFIMEHIAILVCACLLLAVIFTLAFAVPAIESDVHDTLHYRKMGKTFGCSASSSSLAHKAVLSSSASADVPQLEFMQNQAEVQWISYLTADLQFIAARTPVAASSGILAFVASLALVSAISRSQAFVHYPFSQETSIYKWTTFPTFFLQLATVVIFLFTAIIRAGKAILFSSGKLHSFGFHLEPFWQQVIVNFKFKPVPISATDPQKRKARKIAQLWKARLCTCLMWVEGFFVQLSIACCVAFSWVKIMHRVTKRLSKVSLPENLPDISRLQEAMVCLPGENQQQLWRTSKHLAHVSMGIEKGKNSEIGKLVKLLKPRCEAKVDFSKAVRQVLSAYNESGIDDEEILSWSLVIPTLLAVMTGLEWETKGTIDDSLEAMDAFTQALDMVSLIDKHFRVPKKPWEGAACLVWANLELRTRWLHVDLINTNPKINGPILLHLEESAQRIIQPPPNPVAHTSTNELVAAQILLVIIDSLKLCEQLHQKIEPMVNVVTDVMGACLTSLPLAVGYQIHKIPPRDQLAHLRDGLYFLGKGMHLWDSIDWDQSSIVFPMQGSIQAFLNHA